MIYKGVQVSESKQNWPLWRGACCLLSLSPVFGWVLCRSSASSGSLRPAVPSRQAWPGLALEGDSACLPFPWHFLESFILFCFNGELLATALWPCGNTQLMVSSLLTLEGRFYFVQILVTRKRASLFLGTLMLWVQTQPKAFARNPRGFFHQKNVTVVSESLNFGFRHSWVWAPPPCSEPIF